MFIVALILALLLSVAFAGAGVQKLLGSKMMREAADHLKIPYERYRLIGIPELAAVVGLLVGLAFWPLGVAAAAGLVILMVGAVVIHLRSGDKVAQFGMAAVLGVLALLELIFRVLSA
jgi:uncharacterized membrane protein YphA (DoxX/SURF4 family)